MRTIVRSQGPGAVHILQRSVPAWLVAGLMAMAPLGASSAAAPDTPMPATSAAVVELVPLDAAAGHITPPASVEAPSDPVETVLDRGSASYYAAKFNGRRTASGERFDNADMTAAHRTLPFGTRVRVTNTANGRGSVVVRINDRGPFTRGRMIDVSRAAADQLGLVARGHGDVELAVIAD